MGSPLNMPTLEGGLMNLSVLRESAKRDVIRALGEVPGKKCLILDPDVSSLLSLVLKVDVLREHGVASMFKLARPATRDLPLRNLIFILRPETPKVLILLDWLYECIHGSAQEESTSLQRDSAFNITVAFVPRRSTACEKLIEEQGFYADVRMTEIHGLDVLAMEDDVLSLEWRGAYKELMVDGDTACILALARAVMKLQCLFGVIPHVRAKGDFAVYTSELMDRMRKEMQSDSSTCLPISSTISNVIILDRQLDRITPLMTPLTYEGLLDEVFGIRNGSIEVDPAIMGKESTPSGSGPTATASPRVKVPLNGSDSTFREVRDLNFGKTSELLQEKVKRIKSDYTSTRAHSSIGEIKSFVKKLHAMPELQRHVALADALNQATGQFGFRQKLEMEQGMLEAVTEYLEEGIEEAEEKVFKQEPLERALRLACLASVIGEGVGRRNLEGLKRAVLHSYGYQHLVTLENLDKAQLLRRHVNRGPFKDVCRGLKLVVDELDNENPEDIAYTHAVQAYAPLSVRLVELALRDSVAGDGWLGKEAQEILEKLPGAFRDYYQRTETDGNATVVQNVTKSSSSSQLAPSASMSQEHLSTALVVFVGGATLTEISALRFAGARTLSCKATVLTTDIVNGDSLLRSLMTRV
mmetsp:Transcript_1730/g.6086  ORF Transcript_1730/g.6086 Transcript_1730/m.6086 type:complete len:641 (-) Transcript_1730:273-2195(-)